MNRSVFFALVVFLFATACSDKNKLPSGILSKQQMQAVMWDMVRAGEFLNGYVLYKDSAVDKSAESQKWYDKVYQLHKITKQEFDRSYGYYETHPLLMKEILDSLARKQVSTRVYGQRATPAKADTAKKKTLSPLIDTRIRQLDSSRRKRILNKIPRVE